VAARARWGVGREAELHDGVLPRLPSMRRLGALAHRGRGVSALAIVAVRGASRRREGDRAEAGVEPGGGSAAGGPVSRHVAAGFVCPVALSLLERAVDVGLDVYLGSAGQLVIAPYSEARYHRELVGRIAEHVGEICDLLRASAAVPRPAGPAGAQ
jgi:hypothetical protein